MNINDLSIKEKIGQMLMFAYHGNEFNDQLKAFSEEFNLGGVVSFARNIINVNQVSKLNQDLLTNFKIPPFIALDQEGGSVLRIMSGITPLPGAMALSSSNFGKENIYNISKAVGLDLKHLGFNVNFAPVADVNNNPKNPVINSRSFSDDPHIVAKCVKNAFLGFQDAGLLPTVKHFPGHGNTSVDSHIGLPVVEASLDDISNLELIPFKEAINAGIDGVMISHILYKSLDPIYPASLSKKIINDLLIEKLGFKGLIVTDSLTMGAIYNQFTIEEIIYHGINAGNDILVFCGRADLAEQRFIYNKFVELVENGRIPIERINKSVDKILKLKKKYCNNKIDLGKINLETNNELAKKIQEESITKVINNGLIPVTKDDNVLVLFPKINVVTLVDNENQKSETLKKFLGFDEIIYDANKENYLEILEKSKKYNKILMATYNVTEGDYQVELFNLLDKEKVAVVALRSPYDINKLDGCKNFYCCYEATLPALKALSRVIKGEIKANGKLPVKLN